MSIPRHIQDEIGRHPDIEFKSLSMSDEGVSMAVQFLRNNGKFDLADELVDMTNAGRIHIGPLDGFVAAVVLMQGQRHVYLSNRYPEYNTALEIAGSLVHEIGSVDLCAQVLAWYKINRKPSVPAASTVISTAVLKFKEQSKNN